MFSEPTTSWIGRAAAAAILLALAGGANAKKAPPTDPMSLKATGEPRTCIPSRANVSTKPAGNSVLMFRAGTSSWFRNELRAICPALRDDRILIFRTTTTQYCELDPFDVVDPVSGINFGICSLGRFTPVGVPKGTRFGN
jgi:hypothetical protein